MFKKKVKATKKVTKKATKKVTEKVFKKKVFTQSEKEKMLTDVENVFRKAYGFSEPIKNMTVMITTDKRNIAIGAGDPEVSVVAISEYVKKLDTDLQQTLATLLLASMDKEHLDATLLVSKTLSFGVDLLTKLKEKRTIN